MAVESEATFNVTLRVTNEQTSASQVHDVLVDTESRDEAEEQAPEELALSETESVEVIDTERIHRYDHV